MSASTVIFGWQPPEFVIPLPRMGDYLFGLRAPAAWPAGISIAMKFYRTPDPGHDHEPIVWTASIAGTVASWHATAEQVATVRDEDARYVWLVYTDSAGTPMEWMRGQTRAY